MIKIPSLTLAISFCLGVVVTVFLKATMTLILAVLLYSLLILASIKALKIKKRMFILILSSYIFLVLGIARVQLYNITACSFDYISKFSKSTVRIEAVIQSDIEERKTRNQALTFAKSVDNLDNPDNVSNPKGLILVEFSKYADVSYRDKVTLEGMFTASSDFEVSYSEYLRSKSILGIMKNVEIIDIQSDDSWNFFVLLKDIKRKVCLNINAVLPQPHSSLLSGIVFGGTSEMSSEFEEKLRRTGTTHIIAVSGYNVTVLIASIGIFSSLIGRRYLCWLSILFVLAFMLFVGIDNIPVVRASLMGIIYLLGQAFGRKRGVVVLLFLVVSILLVFNPLVCKQISFQLSFFSTLGLILFSSKIEKKLTFMPVFTREDFASTLSALLVTIPITVVNFNELSLISPLANLLVLPVISYITIAGFVFSVSSFYFPFIVRYCAFLVFIPIDYAISIIEICSNFNWSLVKLNSSYSLFLSLILLIYSISYFLESIFEKNQE